MSSYVRLSIEKDNYKRFAKFLVLDIEEDVIFGIPWLCSIKMTELNWNNWLLSFTDIASKTNHVWYGAQKEAFRDIRLINQKHLRKESTFWIKRIEYVCHKSVVISE